MIHFAASSAVLNTDYFYRKNISYIWADITLDQFQYCF